MTFRQRLLRLVFLPSALLLIGVAVTAWLVAGQIIELQGRHEVQLARSLELQVENELFDRARFLSRLVPLLEAASTEQRRTLFPIVAAIPSQFESVYLLDRGLIIVSEAPPDPSQTGNDLSGLEVLRRTGNTTAPQWSDSFISQRTGRPTVSVKVSFSQGVLLGNIDLEPLAQLVANLSEGNDGTVSVVDSHGTYLANSDPEVVRRGDPDLEYLSQRERNQNIPFAYDKHEGRTAVHVLAFPIKTLGWSVLVSRPASAPLEPLAPLLWVLVPLVGLFCLGAFVMVRLLDRHLLSALDLLKMQTEDLGRGEYTGAGLRTAYSDINLILESFETMRQSVWIREQDLRLGEHRFRRMFEDAAVGIFHSTFEGRLIDLNQTMATSLGYPDPKSALEGLNSLSVALFVRPEERQAILKMLQDSPQSKIRVTTEFFHSSGRILSINLHLSRVFEPKVGEFILEAFAEDVTELKRAERSIVELNQALEAKVSERTKHLERTLEDLERAQVHLVNSEKMAALGQLVSGIAHEVNTPLAAIHASNESISVLLDDVLGGLPQLLARLPPDLALARQRLFEGAQRDLSVVASAELRRRRKSLALALGERGWKKDEETLEGLVELGVEANLDEWMPLLNSEFGPEAVKLTYEMVCLEKSTRIVASASERAAKVISALRIFSHQAQESTFERVNVVGGWEMVLMLFKNRLKQGITVKTKFDKDAWVWGLADKLNQVWTNLISNALHAIADKGNLEIVISQTKANVRVSVIDDGAGIPDDIRNRVFEPFFTTKKAGEGTGLGLDICKSIVEDHHGTIGFESRPGRTEFYVVLPVVR